MIKKWIAVALITSIGSGWVAPRSARAAVALSDIGFAPLLTVAMVYGATSLGVVAVHNLKAAAQVGGTKKILRVIAAIASAFGAVFLLDADQGAPKIASGFHSLTAAQAAQVGLNQLEFEAYSDELPMINALAEQAVVDADRSDSGDSAQLLRSIRDHWTTSAREHLSDNALAAVNKVTQASLSR